MNVPRIVSRQLVPVFVAFGFASCAHDEIPLARHDRDGDGAISHAEYQQNQMQYNMADRQRADEYSRARLVTSHMDSIADLSGKEADRALKMLKDFEVESKPKAVPDPKELKHPAKGL